MKKILVLSLLTAATATCGLAQAQTADLQVTGKILPEACKLVVSGGGIIDYGAISADKLSKDDVTHLDKREQTLTVTCNAATKFAIRATDNRSGTAPAGVGYFDQDMRFGLGGKSTGYYVMFLNGGWIEGNSNIRVLGDSGSGTWVDDIDARFFKPNGGDRKAFGFSGNPFPAAHKVLNSSLVVDAYLNKRSALDIGSGIDLDGSATLELIYL